MFCKWRFAVVLGCVRLLALGSYAHQTEPHLDTTLMSELLTEVQVYRSSEAQVRSRLACCFDPLRGNLVSFVGKNNFILTDVPPLLRALFYVKLHFCFCSFFCRRALVRSCLVRELLRLSGVIKGWWAETPHLPPAVNDGGSFRFLFCRLILQKANNPPSIIKAKLLFLFVHTSNSSSNTAVIYISFQTCQNAWSKRHLTKCLS